MRGLPAALERPEKLQRAALVDTADPATSGSDRKAGGQVSRGVTANETRVGWRPAQREAIQCSNSSMYSASTRR
jgi:hypothetical protein